MPSSSTRATYGGSNAQEPSVNSQKIQVSPRVPVHLTYNMDRFAQESGKKTGDDSLRLPLVFRQAGTQVESKARMQAELRDFDNKFNKKSNSGNKGTSANK